MTGEKVIAQTFIKRPCEFSTDKKKGPVEKSTGPF
jgi:hypothetical protein